MSRKRDLIGMAVSFVVALILATALLAVTSGCKTYNDNIAKYIPQLGIEASVGGKGIGAGIKFESSWEDGERERVIKLSPEIDKEKLEELTND